MHVQLTHNLISFSTLQHASAIGGKGVGEDCGWIELLPRVEASKDNLVGKYGAQPINPVKEQFSKLLGLLPWREKKKGP